MEDVLQECGDACGSFCTEINFCAWLGAIAHLPPQRAPLILAHDFPVLDFYISNIRYCFMKCDKGIYYLLLRLAKGRP